MIIGVDGNEANVEKKVGVSVYAFELLNYFAKKASPECQFIIYLKNNPRSDLPLQNENFRYQVIKGNFLWSQIFLPINLYWKKKVDIFFSPAHYAPRFSPTTTVVTIHDLSYFYFPQEFLKKDLFQLKNWTEYSVKKAVKIIAVSKTTKKDLLKFYHIADKKVEVIYNGFSRKKLIDYHSCKNFKSLFLRSKKFFLSVGTIQPRKNYETLIDAFNLLLKEKPEYYLIIVGKKGWLYEKIFNKVHQLGLNNKIIFTGYLKDEELSYLYQKATSFVFPSLYEGFGIPLLEAMNFGCPVISSFSSCLPEIGGEACLYFDPLSPQDLKEKMIELLKKEELKKELIKKGKERIKFFSWEKCGEETLQCLKDNFLKVRL